MKPRDLVFGLFAPSTFEHTYPVRSDVYSHIPFTFTVKTKKEQEQEQEEENRKKKQSNKPKKKQKEGKNNRVH